MFAADALRKQGRITEAYDLLLGAVDQSKRKGLEVPLKANAMVQELKRADGKSKNESSEVSKFFYDNIYLESEKYKVVSSESIYLPVWKLVVDYIERENAKSVLDIGCGPGQFAEYLLNRIPKINYTGIDFSEIAINQAKKRCPKGNFLVRNIMEDGALNYFSADVYIILEVLEHIEQDKEIIARIEENKGVIFSVPNFDSFGHVRFLKDETQVKDRYKFGFDSLEISTIHLKGRSRIYLGQGVRSKVIDCSSNSIIK